MNVLCIVDVPDWAFAKNCRGLQKYGKNTYTIRYGREDRYKSAFKKTGKFDLILFFVDVRIDYLVKRNAPKSKTIVLVRSDVRVTCKKKPGKYWKEVGLMKQYIKCFMVANKEMLKWTRMKFPMKKSFFAPGGVDTELFKPQTRTWNKVPVVGWAGSKKNFGANIRGLKTIRRACKQLGWDYRPAYRESTWRSPQQMLQYYHNIDLYIDLYSAPGRQNGLLEAGACGVPLVSCDKGIARELTAGGLQIANRNVNSVKAALRRAWREKGVISRQIANHVAEEWGWKKHVEQWEEILNSIKTSAEI